MLLPRCVTWCLFHKKRFLLCVVRPFEWLGARVEYEAKAAARTEKHRVKVARERAVAALNLLKQLLSPSARLKRVESAHEMHEQLVEGNFSEQVKNGIKVADRHTFSPFTPFLGFVLPMHVLEVS